MKSEKVEKKAKEMDMNRIKFLDMVSTMVKGEIENMVLLKLTSHIEIIIKIPNPNQKNVAFPRS